MAHYKILETNGQTFKDLCQVGDDYRNEVGTSGVRRGALGNLEAALGRTMKAAKDFQVANRSPQSTDAKGVANLAAFHTSQQSHIKDAEQKRLNDAVIRIRTWLSRQGAWFGGESGVNWEPTMKATVVYDSQLAEQNTTKISIIAGLLRLPDGSLLDTSKMVTHFSGPGYAIYVMSAEGNLHISSHSVGHRHHSSLLGGAPVAGAGEIKASGGMISFLSNKSGHYRPQRCHLLNVLGMLQHNGVNLDFLLNVQPENEKYNTVDAFMVANKLDDDSIRQAEEDAVYITSDMAQPPKYDYPGTYVEYKPTGSPNASPIVQAVYYS